MEDSLQVEKCNIMYWNLITMLEASRHGSIDYGALIQEFEETRRCDQFSIHLKAIREDIRTRTGNDAYMRIVNNADTEDDLIRAARTLQHYHTQASTCAYRSLPFSSKIYYHTIHHAASTAAAFGLIGGLAAFVHKSGPQVQELVRKRQRQAAKAHSPADDFK